MHVSMTYLDNPPIIGGSSEQRGSPVMIVGYLACSGVEVVAQWRSGAAVAQWRSGAVAQWRCGAVAQWRSGAVAQWPELQTSH